MQRTTPFPSFPLFNSPVPRHTFLSPRHACLGQGKIRKKKSSRGLQKRWICGSPTFALCHTSTGARGLSFILLTFSEGKKWILTSLALFTLNSPNKRGIHSLPSPKFAPNDWIIEYFCCLSVIQWITIIHIMVAIICYIFYRLQNITSGYKFCSYKNNQTIFTLLIWCTNFT